MLGKVLGALAQTLALMQALPPSQESGKIYLGWESGKLLILFPRDISHEIITNLWLSVIYFKNTKKQIL